MQCILTPNKKAPYNLRLIVPAYGSATIPDMSQDEWIARTISRNIDVGVLSVDSEYWVVEEEDLPGGSLEDADSYFFDCWEWHDGITVNMAKARTVHLAAIRRARDNELAAMDIAWMKAAESGDTNAQTKIAAEKQILRDLPQTFDLTARTPEQLRARWPKELPRRTA